MNRTQYRTDTPTTTCPVCGTAQPESSMFPGPMLRPRLSEYIRNLHPDWDPNDVICLDCVNRLRYDLAMNLLTDQVPIVTPESEFPVEHLYGGETAARNVEFLLEQEATVGERIADRVAGFGGSWSFIMIFCSTIVVWMAANILLLSESFDPYPFILLNLVLSCLAAIQAPIILMSQNRQAARDRIRSENDYRVNLKAELEVRHLHDKLDLLLNGQWQKLMEVQAIQMEIMEELMDERRENGSGMRQDT